ncbi:phiSA1p31-related protein [Streptomyces sp. NPDC053499]|uniref:phiSA1p31-related protein n=1 Tax=Streptomyces sp. NPDC053499 TaxID=3365707 RepID=UPI0037D124BF
MTMHRPGCGHLLHLTIGPDMVTAIGSDDSVCDATAAAWLRQIADQLDADHGPGPCDHAAMRARHGHLDIERRVWTDGTGRSWDLALDWQTPDGHRWRWTGRLSSGAPMMRPVTVAAQWEPLDMLHAVRGPLVPVGGGRP